MSKLKDLFNYIFQAHEEYGMDCCTTEEVVAFATGLRDGETLNSPEEYNGDSCLKSFYLQGFRHRSTHIRSDGEHH